MNITAEEKLMYEVMRAIYESGIPISFKGSMVLKAFLIEEGYTEDTRHTVDIDANWNSDIQPSDKQMTESLQKTFNDHGLCLDVSIYRMYGEGRSAGFDIADHDTGDQLFTMDIDVNRPAPETKIYQVGDLHFCGVSPYQILADKISVVSTDKIFRRIKDLVDLYYASKVFPFDRNEIYFALRKSDRRLGNFDGFLHREDDLRHAYEKFRFTGDIKKPSFNEIYRSVNAYIRALLPREKELIEER